MEDTMDNFKRVSDVVLRSLATEEDETNVREVARELLWRRTLINSVLSEKEIMKAAVRGWWGNFGPPSQKSIRELQIPVALKSAVKEVCTLLLRAQAAKETDQSLDTPQPPVPVASHPALGWAKAAAWGAYENCDGDDEACVDAAVEAIYPTLTARSAQEYTDDEIQRAANVAMMMFGRPRVGWDDIMRAALDELAPVVTTPPRPVAMTHVEAHDVAWGAAKDHQSKTEAVAAAVNALYPALTLGPVREYTDAEIDIVLRAYGDGDHPKEERPCMREALAALATLGAAGPAPAPSAGAKFIGPKGSRQAIPEAPASVAVGLFDVSQSGSASEAVSHCRTCQGVKRLNCTECVGRSRATRREIPCAPCNNWGDIPCPECNPKGRRGGYLRTAEDDEATPPTPVATIIGRFDGMRSGRTQSLVPNESNLRPASEVHTTHTVKFTDEDRKRAYQELSEDDRQRNEAIDFLVDEDWRRQPAEEVTGKDVQAALDKAATAVTGEWVGSTKALETLKTDIAPIMASMRAVLMRWEDFIKKEKAQGGAL